MDDNKIREIYRLNRDSALSETDIQRIKDAICLKEAQTSKHSKPNVPKRKKFCVILTTKRD